VDHRNRFPPSILRPDRSLAPFSCRGDTRRPAMEPRPRARSSIARSSASDFCRLSLALTR
jgi:hypothetical protein